MFASVLLHGAVIAAFVFVRGGSREPSYPVVAIHMIAAPAGPRHEGVVEPTPAPVMEKPAPVVAPPPKPVVAAKPVPAKPTAKPKTTPKTLPKQATETAPPKAADAPVPKDAPKAGGGETGGKGADVATIETPGLQFDYPYYTKNIVSKLVQYFGAFNGTLRAEVQFVIRRDGSVDPNTIRIVTSSRVYQFDQRAMGAVEAAANAKAFGPLPPTFREDVLPVTFWFSPSIIR